MTNKPTLAAVLADLLDSRPMERPLSGGLMFQFKEPDAEKPFYRLFCYRRGDTPPSTTEFGTVRRELEKLLPGKEIRLASGQFQYRATDSANRTGRVFTWLPETGRQLDMGLAGSPSVQYD